MFYSQPSINCSNAIVLSLSSTEKSDIKVLTKTCHKKITNDPITHLTADFAEIPETQALQRSSNDDVANSSGH